MEKSDQFSVISDFASDKSIITEDNEEAKLEQNIISLCNYSIENNEIRDVVLENSSANESESNQTKNYLDKSKHYTRSKELERIVTIGEHGGTKDLTISDQPTIKNGTIEELKLRLERKEFLLRPRTSSPTSSISPTSPIKNSPGEDFEDMIPETRTPLLLNDDGLIAPRKPVNPVREDPGRQNLHRELLFNQKIGKSVLNQKSELQKALEKHKDNIAKKQLEHHIADKTPELEKVIADRARRLENPVKQENEEDKVINKEFLKARMKLKSTNESK